MKATSRSVTLIASILFVGIYRLTLSIVDADRDAVTQPQTQSFITARSADLSQENKPIGNAPLPATKQQLSNAQSGVSTINQRSTPRQHPAVKTESMSRAVSEGQELATSDPSQLAQKTKLQEIEIQRLGLGDVNQVIQAAQQHPDAQVRKAAIEKLAQLELEHEVTNGVERRSGEVGQFVTAIAEHLPYESDPSALDAGLDYLVEYAENAPVVRQSLDNLLQRSDLSPDMLARVYELLIERYQLTRDDANAQIFASPTVQTFDNNDWHQLEESLAPL